MDVAIETDFGTPDDYGVTFKHAEWTLSLCLDTADNEIIFDLVTVPDRAIVIALSPDWVDADVIAWIAGPIPEGGDMKDVVT